VRRRWWHLLLLFLTSSSRGLGFLLRLRLPFSFDIVCGSMPSLVTSASSIDHPGFLGLHGVLLARCALRGTCGLSLRLG
jgi:hypothetical protein